MVYIQDSYRSLEEMKEHKRLWVETYDLIRGSEECSVLFKELWELQCMIWEAEGITLPKGVTRYGSQQ